MSVWPDAYLRAEATTGHGAGGKSVGEGEQAAWAAEASMCGQPVDTINEARLTLLE